MGTTASPSTPYCSGLQQAALSVGGQIFTTQNPPISYTISGTTVTVSDAGGVIGTADLSGNLVLESTQSASPSTNYCGGKPKAVLKWDKGSIETTNTPISYSLSNRALSINGVVETFPKEIDPNNPYVINETQREELVWDSGSVTGSNISYSLKEPCIRASFITDCVPGGSNTNTWNYIFMNGILGRWLKSSDSLSAQLYGSFCFSSQDYYRIVNGVYYPAEQVDLVKFFNDLRDGNPYTDGDGDPYTGGQVYSRTSPAKGAISLSFIGGKIVISGSDNDGEYDLIDPSSIQTITGGSVCTLTINYQDGTTFDYGEIPCNATISVIANTVIVSDNSGTVGTYSYTTEPTDFQAICYDYDLKEVSYVCEGNCPGGTEFQCKCVESNILSCFGYDPADPNWFRPLFVTQLTA